MPHSTRATAAMADTSSLPTMTRQWILASTPGAAIDIEKTFQQRKVSLFSDEIPDWDSAVSHVLLKTKWLSNDPAQRTWISPLEADRHYVKPTRPGDLMPSLTVGEVIFSTHKDYQVGEFISGFWGWSEYALMDPDNVDPLVPLMKIPVGLDPADFLSLGMTALTAYSGLLFVGECDPSTDKTVVVSGAAGATGSIVVQIAKKVLGIERVIAIAGSEEKCKKVREIGADIALNYKSPNFHEEFEKATDGFVDVYYDNVGTHLDMVVKKMAKFGRVVSCGAIGFYDGDQDQKVLSASAYTQMVFNQIQIRPFLVTKYYNRIPEMQITLQTWIQEGKLSPLRTIWDASFDEIPQGMIKLLKGENTGKLITAL